MTHPHKNKPGAGRPRKTLDKLRVISALAQDGYTIEEIAHTLGINRDTLWRWRRMDPKLSDACEKGAQGVTRRVMSALATRALGTVVPDVHVSSYQGEVTVTPVEKHLAPDVLAQIFWLKNRDPEHWSDRQDIKVETTINGIPEATMDRIRAAAKAYAAGQIVEVEVEAMKALTPPPPEKPEKRGVSGQGGG